MLKKAYTLITFLLLIAPLWGQSFGKEMLGKKKQVSLPFNFVNGFIVVDLIYDKTFPLRFVFDTGAEHTILFKKVYPDLLGTEYDQHIKIYGADLSKNLTALIARDRYVQLENTTAIQKDIVVMEQILLDLEEVTGVRIDGILGGEYFRGLVVEIDYKKEKITLYDPDRFSKDLRKHTKIPLTIKRNKPYLNCKYSENGDSVKTAKMLLDSGAGLSCLFHHNSSTTIQLPSKILTGSLGLGLGGDIQGFMGKINTLEVGPFEFNNLVANYQSIDSTLFGEDEIVRNGIIGNLILERFNVIINYQKEEAYFKPIKNYNKNFKYDKSGLFLYAYGLNLDQYFIRNVIKGSPAYEAGLRQGDLIKKVGFWSSRWYSLQGITNKLSGDPGKKIKLKVERKGECLSFEFRLRDLFEPSSNKAIAP